MFFSKTPKISVCIPVYGTEDYLKACLESVAKQTAPQGEKNFFEIIVVDDCSPEEEKIKAIIKEFKKIYKCPLTYLRHPQNTGVLEVRKTAVYEAKGTYITMVDSDDYLAEDALLNLYNHAIETGADIVQGAVNVHFTGKEGSENYKNERKKIANMHSETQLLEKDILDGFIVTQNHNGFLWAKLITRETYLNAYNHIPPVYCIYADDFLQYFWIAFEAKKYSYTNTTVYNYSINTGISSGRKITDLDRWQQVCSTSTVFTALFTEVENAGINLDDNQKDAVAMYCRTYLADNLKVLKYTVVPELKEQAREMLEDFWGKEFVAEVENLMEQREKDKTSLF